MALMTETEIKSLTTIQEHVDNYLIENAIEFCEKRYIRDAIGRDLYADLVANPGVGENPTLIGHLKPALATFVHSHILPDLHIKETNKGVMLKGSDQSINASTRDVEYKRKIKVNDAEFHLRLALEYLVENKADFPLFNTGDCDDRPGTQEHGIYIPKGRNKKPPIWLTNI